MRNLKQVTRDIASTVLVLLLLLVLLLVVASGGGGGGGGGYTDLIVSVVRCYRLIGSHQPAGQHNTTSYVIITLFRFHTNIAR